MMSASFISMLKRPSIRPSSGFVSLSRFDVWRVCRDAPLLLHRNVGHHKYVSNRMDGMPDMSRRLYRSRTAHRVDAPRVYTYGLSSRRERVLTGSVSRPATRTIARKPTKAAIAHGTQRASHNAAGCLKKPAKSGPPGLAG
jgi:hypothetical protein